MTYTKGNVITISIILLVVIIVTYYAWLVVKKHQQELITESPAALSLNNEVGSPYTDLEGRPVNLTDYLGEVLVVASWASWCPACANELAELTELSKTYEERGVKILAINRSEPATTAQRFLKSINASDEIMLVLDPNDKYFQSIGGYTMPEIVIYDKSGNIVHHQTGEMSSDEMRLYVDQAISYFEE